jgi:predicted ATPase
MLIFAGVNEWQLGYPDGAVRYADAALSMAWRQNKPLALACANAIGAGIYARRGDFIRALDVSDEAVRLSTASGFQHFRAIGKIYSGWARAQMGEVSGSVDRIKEGLAELNPQKFHVATARYLALLCEAQAVTGDGDDALVTVEHALQASPEVLIYPPELLRLRGELKLRNDMKSEVYFQVAERDFREAIHMARSMSAKSMELLATTSLARLLRYTGRRDEGRAMLAEVYNWFTEGFDTADLKDAKNLLDELSA